MFAAAAAFMAGFFAAKIICTVIYFCGSRRYKKRIPINSADPNRAFIILILFILSLIILLELFFLHKYGEWYDFTETVETYIRAAFCGLCMLVLIFEAAFGAKAYITEDGILTQAAFYPKGGAKYLTETGDTESYILLFTKNAKNVSKAKSDFAFTVKPKNKDRIKAAVGELYEKFDGVAPKLKKRSCMKRNFFILACSALVSVGGLALWYSLEKPVIFVGEKVLKTEWEYALFDTTGYKGVMFGFTPEFDAELTERGLEMYGYVDATENLTPKDMAALKQMPNLKYLSVYGSSITDLSEIGELTRLEGLAFGKRIDNGIPEDYSPLKNLTNLKYFCGAGLENLHDLTVFENAGELVYFELTCADIQSGLDAVCENENLAVLELFRCMAEDFSAIGKCSNLKGLSLTRTNAADLSFLKNLTELEYLHISYIDANDYSVLLELPSLKKLYATDSDIPREIIDELAEKGVGFSK